MVYNPWAASPPLVEIVQACPARPGSSGLVWARPGMSSLSGIVQANTGWSRLVRAGPGSSGSFRLISVCLGSSRLVRAQNLKAWPITEPFHPLVPEILQNDFGNISKYLASVYSTNVVLKLWLVVFRYQITRSLGLVSKLIWISMSLHYLKIEVAKYINDNRIQMTTMPLIFVGEFDWPSSPSTLFWCFKGTKLCPGELDIES